MRETRGLLYSCLNHDSVFLGVTLIA